MGGLAALQGVRHGGYTGRVEAFLREARSADMVRQVMLGRLQRGEAIPGFGHRLYPDGDPRAEYLLAQLRQVYGGTPIMNMVDAAVQCGAEFLREKPSLDWALVALTKTLKLADGVALALFALGRTVGWIAHAIEQYETQSLIRPRAKYTGALPPE
jgi:citrate synthase